MTLLDTTNPRLPPIRHVRGDDPTMALRLAPPPITAPIPKPSFEQLLIQAKATPPTRMPKRHPAQVEAFLWKVFAVAIIACLALLSVLVARAAPGAMTQVGTDQTPIPTITLTHERGPATKPAAAAPAPLPHRPVTPPIGVAATTNPPKRPAHSRVTPVPVTKPTARHTKAPSVASTAPARADAPAKPTKAPVVPPKADETTTPPDSTPTGDGDSTQAPQVPIPTATDPSSPPADQPAQ